MSGTKGMTRRSFLGSALATGALAACGTTMLASGSWLVPASSQAEARPSLGDRDAYLYHRTHCGCHCSLKCTVKDGRVCLIQPNSAYQDAQYRHVCVKGISEIQHIYSSERIQTPMKRVGKNATGGGFVRGDIVG